MSRLYPPILDEKIPAFYDNNLSIPIIMNSMVSMEEVSGFHILLKSVTTNTIKQEIDINKINTIKNNNFILTSDGIKIENFNVGEYYKIQIAYKNLANELGYYSSAGIIKCTSQPTVTIDGLNVGGINNTQLQYNGIYNNEDFSEKVYSYEFRLYKDDMLLESSGKLIHDNSNTENTLITNSYDSYIFKTDINTESYNYKVIYEVTTVNNLTVTSPEYTVTSMMAAKGSELSSRFILVAETDENNGTIIIRISSKIPEESQGILNGKFILCRKNCTKNTGWYPLTKFEIARNFNNSAIYRDYFIEHGNYYLYSLQQFGDNNTLLDQIKTETMVQALFNDMFLYDGKKQLKIQYNPKVTSFKVDVSMTKIDTLGNKYPVFFRGGNMGYKEFPISGLISYYSDENELFLKKSELFIEKDIKKRKSSPNTKNIQSVYEEDLESVPTHQATTNLIHDNIHSERIFKMNVLDFLNDGKPKIFKSPGEGSYVVMLMNISLSPEDKLGRMLHTFSCTAYEYQEFSYAGLVKGGFINLDAEPYILDVNTIIADEDLQDPIGEEIEKLSYYRYVTILLGPDLNHTLYDKQPVSEDFGYKEFETKTIEEYLTYLENISKNVIDKYKPNNDVIITHDLNKNILPGTCSYIQCQNMIPGTIISINDNLYVIGPTGYFTLSYNEYIIESLKIIEYGIPNDGDTNYLLGQITCKYFDEDSFNNLFNQKTVIQNEKSRIWEHYFDLKLLQNEFNFIDQTTDNDLISCINKRNNLIRNIYVRNNENNIIGFISNNIVYPLVNPVTPIEQSGLPWITINNNYKQFIKTIYYLSIKGKDRKSIYTKTDLRTEHNNLIAKLNEKLNMGEIDQNEYDNLITAIPENILDTIIFYQDLDCIEEIGTWKNLDPYYSYLINYQTTNLNEGTILETYGYISPDCLKKNMYFALDYNPIVNIEYPGNLSGEQSNIFLLKDQSLTFKNNEFLENISSIKDCSENQIEVLINYSYANNKFEPDYNKTFKEINSIIIQLIDAYNAKIPYYSQPVNNQIVLIDFLKQKYLHLIKIAVK